MMRVRDDQKGLKNIENVKELLDNNEAFFFDCDGVIWKGNKLIDRADKVISFLKRIGKKVYFVTNNSTKSRETYKAKFNALGIDVELDEIFPSSFAVAIYFQLHPLSKNKKVFLIGQSGIEEELKRMDISYLGGTKFEDIDLQYNSNGSMMQNKDVEAVVVGLDTEISYKKIQYAQLCLNLNKDCKFIATNLDATTHLTVDQEWAGNGAIVGAIKGCTGIEPIVVGKPSSIIVDYIVKTDKLNKEKVCMVGDRLDTDILFGINNGLTTILTLSGVTTKETLTTKENYIIPDFFISSIGELLAEE